MTPCRWHYDSDVPGGKVLVPGCWNRAVYGDFAECHCNIRGSQDPLQDKINELMARIKVLEKKQEATN